ncbi:conserved phage C-terminal domain-containing protein [Staphylococcus carnosus]|uniref:Replication protein n=2 Tax=Staphylococcus carnosus TaxID=1281 RepID=A0AAJ0NHP2_STACA|nr:conserved phage C-terminal domain-containing protein [Staphylococcus carnosus]KKB24956.1 replication protein [Staphylococcus carnosus]PNZ97158.1 replication protein [Staphylococcus carnosus]QQS85842.1 conserved phage C-terminal domain-containing protein [Staphylococcus carnosus]QRQ05777.1 conserved phage C-terminal domain-containing protein [Staphylococcus carnosus]UTB82230.1 replication protein [Staphylococcus carnosus]
MATFRVHKESGNFVTVHKDFIHDFNISWKAKGILLYLLSRPDDWKIYETELKKHATDGRDSLRTEIKELEEAGYICRTRIRDEKGHFKEYEYQVFELPNQVGKSHLGDSHLGKPDTTNNNSTNNDCTNNDGTILSGNPTVPYQQIVDYLNEKTGKQYKHTTKKTQTLIKARTKEGFTLDDFKQVIDNMSSQWMNDSKMNQYLRPETLFGTKFEGYLNQQQPNTVDEDWKKQYEDVF